MSCRVHHLRCRAGVADLLGAAGHCHCVSLQDSAQKPAIFAVRQHLDTEMPSQGIWMLSASTHISNRHITRFSYVHINSVHSLMTARGIDK